MKSHIFTIGRVQLAVAVGFPEPWMDCVLHLIVKYCKLGEFYPENTCEKMTILALVQLSVSCAKHWIVYVGGLKSCL